MEEQPDAGDLDGPADLDAADAGPGFDEPGHGDPAADGERAEPVATSSDAPQSAPVRLEPTGVPSVDAALARLRDVDNAALDEHVEIFDDVQRQLHDALAELDDE